MKLMAVAVTKSVVIITKTAIMFLLLVAFCLGQQAQAQDTTTCSSQLSTLSVCSPFLAPNAGNPSTECCGALRAVPRDCVCSTLRISARLPTSCSLPPLDCDN
ncbi:unnamed protein product [Rhodiola kirilowii]